jgi:hypothetical protein|tara:strand:+ start:19460 stop:19642 length:183 start_codon:yes stop_codon:yes gene_type:complete
MNKLEQTAKKGGREDPTSNNYYVHTDCARTTLFLGYGFLSCKPCKEYYRLLNSKKGKNRR